MTSVSGITRTCRPGSTRAVRILAPVLFALLGTVGGFVAAEVARRARGPRRHDARSIELAPSGSSLEFDKGGFRVRPGPGLDEPAYSFEPETIMGLPEALRPAGGIRPTFDVEAELTRALDTTPEPALAG